MGGSSSTPRVLSLDKDDSGTVVTVSESVARRLLGRPEPTDFAAESERAKGPSPSRPSIPTHDEDERKSLEALFKQRVAALERQNSILRRTTEEQFARAVKEVEGKFIKPVTGPLVCSELQDEVLRCYQENPTSTLNCSDKVKAFKDCVQQQRQANLSSHQG